MTEHGLQSDLKAQLLTLLPHIAAVPQSVLTMETQFPPFPSEEDGAYA